VVAPTIASISLVVSSLESRTALQAELILFTVTSLVFFTPPCFFFFPRTLPIVLVDLLYQCTVLYLLSHYPSIDLSSMLYLHASHVRTDVMHFYPNYIKRDGGAHPDGPTYLPYPY
jgi:hypothetical protein